MSSSKRTTRNSVEEYSLKDGRKINLLGEGRLINLAAAEGHPPSVMDMSFADQALSVDYMVKNAKTLEKKVYRVPDDLDKRVAKLKLESMGIKIDKLIAGAGRVFGGVVGRNVRAAFSSWHLAFSISQTGAASCRPVCFFGNALTTEAQRKVCWSFSCRSCLVLEDCVDIAGAVKYADDLDPIRKRK